MCGGVGYSYVSDGGNISKMETINLTLMRDVRRIMYANTDVENGTSVVKVRKPPNFVNLLYMIRLFDGESNGMYRVICANQRKL